MFRTYNEWLWSIHDKDLNLLLPSFYVEDATTWGFYDVVDEDYFLTNSMENYYGDRYV